MRLCAQPNMRTLILVVVLCQREITVHAQNISESFAEEESVDQTFLRTGVDRLGGTTTSERHSMFTRTYPQAIRLGQEYQEKLLAFRNSTLNVDLQRASKDIKLENCTPILECDAKAIYRTADGSCNNLLHPDWGQSFIPMRRFLPPKYDDDISSPRTVGSDGSPLPSPRLISRNLHTADTDSSTDHPELAHMAMQWAQFLDHDLDLTAINRGVDGASITCCEEDVPSGFAGGFSVNDRPQCFPIPIPPGDQRFNRTCMNFVRSLQVANADCQIVPAEQLNQLTAYVDASQVYGSTEEEQHELRTFRGGLLTTSKKNPELLPRSMSPFTECVTSQAPNFCFQAGDERVDEHMALASMHTIWLREHNRIARELSEINPHWGDERLFQETRRIVGAMIQHITYTEFLPVVLPYYYLKLFNLLPTRKNRYSNIYNSKIDVSIRNSFATAAYRFGHSMVRSFFPHRDNRNKDIRETQLRTSFGNTSIILSTNGSAVDELTRGLLFIKARRVDRLFTPELRDFLFVDETNNSLDLMALNIQRGRDHGLPGYNDWREWCGLPRASHFGKRRGGLVDHTVDSAKVLRRLYRHPDDIDLFSGGVSERPVQGGLLGRTFSCIVASQFQAIKLGDRFWYETADPHIRFTKAQLLQIKRASLSRIICENTDTIKIQRNALKVSSKRNPIRRCRLIKKVSLRPWKTAAMNTYG